MSSTSVQPSSGAPEPPGFPGDGAPGRRPIVERIGLAAVALVLAALFGGVAVAAFAGGELFLAAMGAIGAVMTIWAGAITLLKG